MVGGHWVGQLGQKEKRKKCRLIGYCDANYATDHDILGDHLLNICSLLNKGPYCAVAKDNQTGSLSKIKTEYRAATMTAQEYTWVQQLMFTIIASQRCYFIILCELHSTSRKYGIPYKNQACFCMPSFLTRESVD